MLLNQRQDTRNVVAALITSLSIVVDTSFCGYICTLNFQIGNQFIRGVSGGQRKRTSIAMEMIVSPAILFLDEPTTGLDATTALSVIRLLHK